MSAEEAERSEPKPLPDPLTPASAELSEPERGQLENLADRTRWLSHASLGAGGMSLVVSALGATGRVDVGVVLFLVPTGLVNLVFGFFLRNAAIALGEAAKIKLRDKKPLLGAVELYSKAFTVQLFAAGFLIVLLFVALIVAASVKRVTQL